MTEQRPAVVLHLLRPCDERAALEARDDDALMILAAADQRRAFEVVAGRHLAPLTRFCAKYLGSPRAGEEVAHDVLVEAWTRRRQYRPEGRLRVLLLTIARTRCLNRLRDDRRRLDRAPFQVDDPGAEAASDGAGQLDALLERERERQVRASLLALPPKLREALLLRYDQGLDYAEIARAVGRSEATIRSQVFHGIRKLRAAVGLEEP
jgi:RNA polymerase sigma-70 factor (ECF subfamily)